MNRLGVRRPAFAFEKRDGGFDAFNAAITAQLRQWLLRTARALLERRGDAYLADRLYCLSLAQGQLVAKGLAAGVYRLWVKEQDAVVEIQVVAGDEAAGWAISPTRMLELRRRPPQAARQAPPASREAPPSRRSAVEGSRGCSKRAS
jgi:hypothetical protein